MASKNASLNVFNGSNLMRDLLLSEEDSLSVKPPKVADLGLPYAKTLLLS